VDRNVQISKTHVVLVGIPFKNVHLEHRDGAGRITLSYIWRSRISGLAGGQNWLRFVLNVIISNFRLSCCTKKVTLIAILVTIFRTCSF
jgi:hypothetical protein